MSLTLLDGSNLSLITELPGKEPWVDSSASTRAGLKKTEAVQVQGQDKWRVGYMVKLLAQRQTWKYMGA